MKKAWNDFLTSLKPTYSVTVRLYHVIPNYSEVQSFSDRENFGKGEYQKAKLYYDRVVRMNVEHKVMPVEVKLIKGRRTVIETRNFGPVDAVKNLNVPA